MRFFFIISFVFGTYSFHGQEVLSSLISNPLLEGNSFIYENKKSSINLPFFDDFAYNQSVVDTNLWMKSSVFINRTYPLNPPTIGVATFDGLDHNGLARDFMQLNLTDPSDTLLSQPIDLSSVSSAYFMFYFQGKGIGDAPQTQDILILEFLNDTLAWEQIWYTNGISMQDFKKVVELIDQQRFLHNSFQFRFVNYATLSGNFDHWHIDYVKLDEFLVPSDTSELNDISFVYQSPSFLKRYEQMPWAHFRYDASEEMNDTVSILLRNNGVSANVNIGYEYKVFQNNTQIDCYPKNFSLNSCEDRVPPTGSFQDYALIGNYQFTNPPIVVRDSVFLTDQTLFMSDSVSFLIRHVINNGQQQDPSQNDTLYYQQAFNSSFAYDDGIAEEAYGLNVGGGKIAYQFKLNRPDILRGVQMYFPQMLNSVDHILFNLTIWDDNGGEPGSILYQQAVSPEHTKNGEYYYYNLDSPLNMANKNIFYVGWEQQTDDLLNIGLDKNKLANQYMFYNTGSGWNNSIYPGAWMIRPVVSLNDVSLSDNNIDLHSINFYPNPAKDELNVISKTINNAMLIYDLQGLLVKKFYISNYKSIIDISDLEVGMYIIQLECPNTRVFHKLIVN